MPELQNALSRDYGGGSDHRVFLAIGIAMAVMGLAIVVAMAVPYLMERFDGEAPDVDDDTWQVIPPYGSYRAIVEVRESRKGFLGYLRRYGAMGSHAEGKKHQAGDKQKPAKQVTNITKWARGGTAASDASGKATSHRKDKK